MRSSRLHHFGSLVCCSCFCTEINSVFQTSLFFLQLLQYTQQFSVHGSSCNDLPKTVLAPYRQARAQNIQGIGLLMTKSLNHINKHQGGSHSENVVCFCVREEHPSCLWTRSIRDQCFHPQNSQALQRFWPPIKFLRPNAFKWFTICRKI